MGPGRPHLRWGAAAGNRTAWLALLRTGTRTYTAQPYQQLAAAYRAEGHDSDVRAILIAQRRDPIACGGLSRIDLWWARFTGVLLGYGYQPWRAPLYLLGVLAVSVVSAVMLGAAGGLAPNPAPDSAAQSCAMIDMVGRGIDLGTPLLPKPTSTACAATSTPAGVTLTVTGWLLQLARGQAPRCSSQASPGSSARPEPARRAGLQSTPRMSP